MPETATVETTARLRAAVELLRTASAAATPGDWTAHLLPANEHRSHPAHWVRAEFEDDSTTTSKVVADCPWRQADAVWIALLRPGVGLLIAAWLESVADRLEQSKTHPDWQGVVEAHALNLADALLAEPAP